MTEIDPNEPLMEQIIRQVDMEMELEHTTESLENMSDEDLIVVRDYFPEYSIIAELILESRENE